MRIPPSSSIALLIFICLPISISNQKENIFCTGSKLQKSYSVTLARRRETVSCCRDDIKPAFCFGAPVVNTFLNETCKCMILKLNSISSRRPIVKFCKWKEKVQMIVRKVAAYLREKEKYEDTELPEYHHYPCEVALDHWRCPDEFKEEVKDKEMDCVPSQFGFPVSSKDTNNLYKCPPEDDFDFHRVSTCARPLCEKRYRHNKGEKACLPPRRLHPEYLGYNGSIIQKSMYCSYENTNANMAKRKCQILPLCADGSAKKEAKVESHALAPPLHYMPKKVDSTIGMNHMHLCQKVCPKDLNVPGAGCQIVPTCHDDGRHNDSVWVERCYPECTAELKTQCNRKLWCLYENGKWVMPSWEFDIYQAGKCAKRTCERYETEFTDNCTRKAEAPLIGVKRTPPLVQSGTGLFIIGMIMVFCGIVIHPETDDEPIDDVSSSWSTPSSSGHLHSSSSEDYSNPDRSESVSAVQLPRALRRSIPKTLVSQTPTEGSGRICTRTQRTPSIDIRKSESQEYPSRDSSVDPKNSESKE